MKLSCGFLEDSIRNFITHSWLSSYKQSPEFKYMRSSMYKAHYCKIISNKLDDVEGEVIVEYQDENKKRLKGYCVFTETVMLHPAKIHSGPKTLINYIYIAKEFRLEGLASRWLKKFADGEYVYSTSINPAFVSLCKKNNLEHIYLPYLR